MAQRIVLTSFGSYGDLHPCIAIGLALKASGFDAVIAASEDYRAKVETAGLDFRLVGPSIAQVAADTGIGMAGAVKALASDGLAFLVGKATVPYADRTFEQMCDALRGADLVVATQHTIMAQLGAAKLGLRTATLVVAPCGLLSNEEPPLLMEAPWMPWLRRTFGPGAVKASTDLGRARLQWRARKIAALRRRQGLPPCQGDEVLDAPLRADLVAGLWSPLFAPLPPDAPPCCEIAGTVFYDTETGAPPVLDPALEAFLDAGAPPLVFTLGSWVVFGAGDFYAAAAEAARRLGRRRTRPSCPG